MGDAIKVFVRVRPPGGDDKETDRCLTVDSEHNAIIVKVKPDPKIFTYDQVADTEVTQESVFSSIGKTLIDSCLDGYNGTIFAYGQTGSGKTFTMIGPAEGSENFHHDLRGVIPRSFEYLFNHISRQKEIHGENIQFLCRCTFLEIYNEMVYDLLDSAAAVGLQLRENLKNGVYVDGLQEQTVTCAVDAYNVLSNGWVNRTVASTSMNRESSRSHAVFTIYVESKILQEGVWKVKSSQLNLVDLAGSERQKDTRTLGVRLKEAGSINKSLSALGNVIMALVNVAHGKTRHVPYRDSKLTFLLRDSLGGNAKTIMITCAHSGFKHIGETLSTLQFARRAKLIKNKAVVNENMHGSVSHLQAEIKRLKEQISQYQLNGDIREIASPSRHDGNSTSSGETNSTDENLQWKANFIDAMYFRQKSEAHIKVLQEKYRRLEETSRRHDQALRQTKLIVKFRESEIKRLKDKSKEELPIDEETKAIISNLESEVKTLQLIVDHHPDLVMSNHRNEALKEEIKRLESMASSQSCKSIDKQRITDLRNIFKQLEAQKNTEGDLNTVQRTPQNDSEKNIATATLERHKSQIEKLQSEIATLKREHSETVTTLKQQIMDKESSLTAAQSSKSKLEKVLHSQQIRAKVERETANDLHNETMKIITTPKKGGYQLRSRSILPGSGSLHLSPSIAAPDFNTSECGSPELKSAQDVKAEVKPNVNCTDDDLDLITNETTPQEVLEEHIRVLAEELGKAKKQVEYLQVQHESHEMEVVKLVEGTSKLESQKNQINEMLSSEKASWTDSESRLTAQVAELQKHIAQELETKEVLQGEVEDLRIMAGTDYKVLQEIKQDNKTFKEKVLAEIATLETKNMHYEVENDTLQKELDQISKNNEHLQDSTELLQAQLSITEDKLSETEDLLQTSQQNATQLQTQIQMLTLSVKHETERNEQLVTQLKEQGDKAKDLANAFELVNSLQDEVRNNQTVIETHTNRLQQADQELLQLKLEIQNLHVADAEKQEALNEVLQQLSDSEAKFRDLEHHMNSVVTQLDERQHECSELTEQLQSLQNLYDAYKDNTNETIMTQQEELLRKTAEYDILCEDIEDQINKTNNALNDYNMISLEHHTLQSDYAESQGRIVELEAMIVEKSQSAEAIQKEYEQRIQTIQSTAAPKDEIIRDLQEDISVMDLELCRRQENIRQLHEQCKQHETQVLQQNEQICKLQEKALNCEDLQKQANKWQAKYDSINVQFETDLNDYHEKQQTLIEELQILQSRADYAEEEALQYKDQVNDMYETLQVQAVDTVSKDQQIDRLTLMSEKDHALNLELNSNVEELKEKYVRTTKEYDLLHGKYLEEQEANAKLAGHQNHMQKIQHVISLKQTIKSLEEIQRTKNYDIVLQQSRKLRGEVGRYRNRCTNLESMLKENHISVTPIKSVSQSMTSNLLTPTTKNTHLTPDKPRTTSLTKQITPKLTPKLGNNNRKENIQP